MANPIARNEGNRKMTSLFDVERWQGTTIAWLQDIGNDVLLFLPKLFAAVLLIFSGLAVAWLAQMITGFVLRSAGLDRLAHRIGSDRSSTEVPPERTLSRICSRFVFWAVAVTFALLAAQALELKAVTESTYRLLAYLPRVVGAAIIVGVGITLGRITHGIVESGASLGSLAHAARVAAAANLAVLIVSCVLALDQLGVSTDIFVSVLTVLSGALALTMGAAFALGSRAIIAHILAGHFLRRRLEVGDEVELEGQRVVVDRVGSIDTLFREGDAILSVPNAMLLGQKMRW